MVPTRQGSPASVLKLPLAEMIGEGSQRKRKIVDELILGLPKIYPTNASTYLY